MPQCVAWGCTKRLNREAGQGQTFYRFPKDPLKRQVWVKALRRESFRPGENTLLCRDHFTDNCFIQPGKELLKDDAVPTIFYFPSHVEKMALEKKTAKEISTSPCQSSPGTGIDQGARCISPQAQGVISIQSQDAIPIQSQIHDKDIENTTEKGYKKSLESTKMLRHLLSRAPAIDNTTSAPVLNIAAPASNSGINEVANVNESHSFRPVNAVDGPSIPETTPWNEVNILCDILPKGYPYKVAYVRHTGSSSVYARVRLPFTTKDEALKWKEEFEETTLCTYRAYHMSKVVGKYAVYKATFRCQRGGKGGSEKKVGCEASLSFTVKKVVKYSRSTDVYMPKFPTEILIYWHHKHPISTPDTLKYRDVSSEVKEKFLSMFADGHSPSSAHDMYISGLQLEFGDDFSLLACDRRSVPDLKYLFRLYHSVYDNRLREVSQIEMLTQLENFILKLNGESPNSAALGKTEDGQYMVAVATPLMKQVGKCVKESGDMIVLDSSMNRDRRKCKFHLFLLMTHCQAGSLPVGALITSSNTPQNFEASLLLFKGLVGEDTFHGRGVLGPAMFLTDDNNDERTILKHVYPSSDCLVCTFYILRNVWKWLMDSKNGISNDDRYHLFVLIKNVVYASDRESADAQFLILQTDSLVINYKGFAMYAMKLFERIEEWAPSVSNGLPLSLNSINGMNDIANMLLRDRLIHRTKSYNAVQTVDFLFKNLDQYYQKMLNKEPASSTSPRHLFEMIRPSPVLPFDNICKIEGSLFVIKCDKVAKKSYYVNMDLGMCTCQIGMNGAPCRHQATVALQWWHEVEYLNYRPISEVPTELLNFKATGKIDNMAGSENLDQNEGISLNENYCNADVTADDCQEMDTADTPASSSVISQASVDKSLAVFVEVCDRIADRMQTKPDIFLPVVDSFVRTMNEITTDSDLLSALSSFGKLPDGTSSILQVQGVKRKYDQD